MNIENANQIVRNILIGHPISEEEQKVLDGYINYLISKMSDNTISYDEQALLDVYTNYLRNNLIDMDIVNKYDDVINQKNNLNYGEENIAHKEGHHKVLIMEKKNGVNNNGIILTSVILEVSLLLGLTIAILILALS